MAPGDRTIGLLRERSFGGRAFPPAWRDGQGRLACAAWNPARQGLREDELLLRGIVERELRHANEILQMTSTFFARS